MFVFLKKYTVSNINTYIKKNSIDTIEYTIEEIQKEQSVITQQIELLQNAVGELNQRYGSVYTILF